MKTLFEYAIIKQDKMEKDGTITDEGGILSSPTTILAKDITEVNIIAARLIPDTELANLDRIAIVVRPF